MDEAVAAPESEQALACAQRIRRSFGDSLLTPAGVVHVTAAWRPPSGGLQVLKIGETTPAIETDRFVLDLSRARADAIVTTGQILRDEPDLSYELPPGHASWRRLMLGKQRPPKLLVLTSGRDLPASHPLLNGEWEVTLYPGPEAMGPSRGLRAAVDRLRADPSLATISIEAGPSSSADLYEPPLAVEELMLSLYEGPDPAATVQGHPLPSLEELESLLPIRSSAFPVSEPSGPWSFRRLHR